MTKVPSEASEGARQMALPWGRRRESNVTCDARRFLLGEQSLSWTRPLAEGSRNDRSFRNSKAMSAGCLAQQPAAAGQTRSLSSRNEPRSEPTSSDPASFWINSFYGHKKMAVSSFDPRKSKLPSLILGFIFYQFFCPTVKSTS